MFVALVACRGEANEPPAPSCVGLACTAFGVVSCSAGFESDGDHGCKPVLAECPAGQIATPGECRAVGVGTCGAGFVNDTDGCRAIVPKACDGSRIAKLGEAECQEIQTCGVDRYPKTTAPSWYVDGAYVGPSDGSEEKPFTTIAAAVAAVTSARSTIAIAAGKYDAITIDRPAALLGVCPDSTTIGVTTISADTSISGVAIGAIRVEKGSLTLQSTWVRDSVPGITLISGTSGTVTNSVVTAADVGIALDAARLSVKSSEIRATNGSAIRARSLPGKPAELTVSSSVITNSLTEGIFSRGSVVTVEDTLIRKTGVAGAIEASGIYADTFNGVTPTLIVRRSVVESTFGMAIGAFGGKATIEDTTVRDTKLSSSGPGLGILTGVDPKNGAKNTSMIERSVFSQIDGVAIQTGGSTTTVRNTIARNVRETPHAQSGRCLYAARSLDKKVSSVVDATDLLIENCGGSGVLIAGGTMTLDRAVVRDIRPIGTKFGYGLVAFAEAAATSTVTVKRSLFERAHDAGLIAFGSQLDIEDTVVREILPRQGGIFGHGVHITSDEYGIASSGSLRGSLITDVYEVGVQVFQSRYTVENTTLGAIRANDAVGTFGDGVSVTGAIPGLSWKEASLDLRSVKVSAAARAAVSAFNARADIQGVLSRCNSLDIAVESITEGHAPTLTDGGANACGCDSLSTCVASQKNLEPVATPN